MEWIGLLASLLFVGLAAHAWWQLRASREVLTQGDSLSAIDSCIGCDQPEVRIVLCLKGADPFLDRTFRQLASQDYRNYRVLIVVDSESDEAFGLANSARLNYGKDRFEIMIRRREYAECSRRANSLLTALEELPENVEVVVLCDGDAVVPTNLLTQLVHGLSEEGVMAVSGNRWYAPAEANLASYSRYFWNALAVPSMEQFGIPWAGCLAFRRSLFCHPGFRKTLRTAFSEDTAIAGHLRRQGLKYKSLPLLKIINEESTTFSSYWGFLVRQMLAVKLHHPDWNKILLHGLILGFTVWILLPLALFSGVVGILATLGSIAVYASTILSMARSYEQQLLRVIPRKNAAENLSFRWRMVILGGLILTALVYPLAVIRAWTTRTHLWRGIRYQIGRNRVRVLAKA